MFFFLKLLLVFYLDHFLEFEIKTQLAGFFKESARELKFNNSMYIIYVAKCL